MIAMFSSKHQNKLKTSTDLHQTRIKNRSLFSKLFIHTLISVISDAFQIDVHFFKILLNYSFKLVNIDQENL